MAERRILAIERLGVPDARRDSAFISTNLSNRPRGPTNDPHYGGPREREGETLIEFLKFLENEAEKDANG